MNRENTYNQALPSLLQTFLQALVPVAGPFPARTSGTDDLPPYEEKETVPSHHSHSPEEKLPTGIAAHLRQQQEGPAREGLKPRNKMEPGGESDHTIYRQVDESPLFLHYEWLSEDMYRQPQAHTPLAIAYFVSQTRQYPELARRVGVRARVWVHFVVEKDGSVSRIEARSKSSFGCKREAVRIFEKMNELGLRWEPARINGKPVRKACQWMVEFTPED